jgi:integrase/recombinase XerD
VDCLDRVEVERLIQAAYRTRSRHGLMIKTLFLTGARVSEFVQVRVEDLHLDSDPPQMHLRHAKAGASRYVPILSSLAQELRTHLHGRRRGHLFESNRRTHYAVRTVQTMVAACAREAGITKRVYPHLLRHSIATILLDSGQMPIDQVQKFLGHRRLTTTQIYVETSVRALVDNYLRALSSPG